MAIEPCSTSPKPTYVHLKIDLQQSDKNQTSLGDETMANVTTVTSLPTDPTPSVSLVTSNKPTEIDYSTLSTFDSSLCNAHCVGN